MKNLPYRRGEIANAIRHNIPFTHNNGMRGQLLGDTYEVYSYATLIFSGSVSNPRDYYFNDTKYSHTTSRQQSIVRVAKNL